MKLIDIIPRLYNLDPSVQTRVAVEAKIAAKVIRNVLATGNWELKGIDLDEGLEPTPTIEDALKLIFDLDDARLYFRCTKEKRTAAWVYFVLGNDGWDVVNDYTESPHGFKEAVDAACGNDDDLANTEV